MNDLSRFDQHLEFDDETFADLECRDKEFFEKEFEDCRFVASQFSQASFVRCKFTDCKFLGCDLSNVSFKGSNLRDVVFEESKVLGVNWTELAGPAYLAFYRSVLDMGNFSGMDMRRWRFEACSMRELELGHANMTQSECRDSDFAGSRFHHTNLTKADLRGASNYVMNPLDNVLTKAKFSMPEAMSLLYGLDVVLEET